MRRRNKKSYRLRKNKKPTFQLDFLAGYLFVVLIFIYISLFGIYITHGFPATTFRFSFIVIIIPIWLIDGMKGFFESFTRRSYRSSTENLEKVTVVIACKDGEEVIGSTLKSLLKRFNPEQIIVASNGSSDGTIQIAIGHQVRVIDIKAPLGKVRAINRALKHVDTPYVLLLDDDTLIDKAKIPTGLLEEGYDGIAFRVLVKVTNWVSKIQMHEYRKSTDLGKRYHNKKASVQNISGAIGLFTKTQLSRQIARHSGEFSGEDLQRTLLIHLAQNAKGVVLTDSTVLTQPPTTIGALFKQRSFGWFPGQYSNFNNYLRVMTRDSMPFALRFDAFYNVFLVMCLDVVRLLSLPILIFYPWYFLIMYLIYFLFEGVSRWRTGNKEPFWVVMAYPFYGLFGFFTRAAAFATFLYRRFAAKLSGKKFLDDYRAAPKFLKAISVILVLTILGCLLALNLVTYFIKPIINVGS